MQAENGNYYVDVPTYAADFANELVASFGDDDSYTVTYSVNAYLANMYKKYAPDSEMYEMLTAIYNYGVSAAAYAAALK